MLQKNLQERLFFYYFHEFTLTGIYSQDIVERLSAKLKTGYIIMFRSVLNSARGERRIKDLLRKNHITPQEEAYFKSFGPNSSVRCLGYLTSLVLCASSAGILGETPNALVSNFISDLAFIRTNCDEITVYLNTQMSFGFVELIGIVVYSFMIQLVYVSASFISVGLSTNSKDKITTGYFTLALYTYVMLGILSLFLTLENPLGYQPGDFPGDVFLNDLIDCLDEARQNALGIMNKNLEMGSSNLLMSDDIFPDLPEADKNPIHSKRTPSPLVYPSDHTEAKHEC